MVYPEALIKVCWKTQQKFDVESNICLLEINTLKINASDCMNCSFIFQEKSVVQINWNIGGKEAVNAVYGENYGF